MTDQFDPSVEEIDSRVQDVTMTNIHAGRPRLVAQRQRQTPIATGDTGALAEYAALRQEILLHIGNEHNIFVLQITVSGAIFSFAVSASGRALSLLIVPFSTYLLLTQFYTRQVSVKSIANYITTVLSPRVPGGLGWEAWVSSQPPRARFFGINNLVPLFSGTSLISLALVIPAITHFYGRSTAAALLWTAAWVAALLFQIATLNLTWRIVGHLILHDWRTMRLRSRA